MVNPADIASASIIDRRLIPARRFAADDPASRVVVRHRAATVSRRPCGGAARRIVERALLRRGCAGHHRERQQGEQDLGRGIRHPGIVARPSRPPPAFTAIHRA